METWKPISLKLYNLTQIGYQTDNLGTLFLAIRERQKTKFAHRPL